MRSISLLVLFLFMLAEQSFCQKYPFPQELKYPNGTMQSIITSTHVKTWYDAWKKKYLQECSGNLRPGVDPLTKSLVEAQGFAMVAVAYMGDKEIFDKLYEFYKSKCSANTCGLMNWKVNCTGVEANGAGAATDGDIDVACALIVAHWQWPDAGYDVKAKDLIGKLDRMVTQCSGLSTVYPGCNTGNAPWGGCSETDISYYTPAFFRYFAEISGNDKWIKLADDTHTIRDNAANKTTGLVPDWQSTSGTAGAGSRSGNFAFDAIRAPYKQTLDYLWNGNEKALVWAKKISTWAHGYGVKNLKDGFQLNGTVSGSSHNMAVVGSLAVAAMSNTQEILDAFATEVLTLKDDYWYSGYLGNLYLLALTGNMWNPDIIGKVGSLSSRQKIAGMVPVKVQQASGQLLVTGVSPASTVQISTMSGQTAYTSSRITDNRLSINTTPFSPGCYLLLVLDKKQKVVDHKVLNLTR